MEIRRLVPDDAADIVTLVSQAFMHGGRYDPPAADSSRWSDGVEFGLFDEHGLQAKIRTIDYTAHLGRDVEVQMGGIAGVACLPASRGKGYAGALVRHALADMRERKQVISTLYPFSWEYYRRFGWEWIAPSFRYTAPTSALNVTPETELVRAATAGDRDAIIACYTEFARRHRGMVHRSEPSWGEILEHSKDRFTYTYVFERGAGIEGYLTWRGGGEEMTEIREFVALNATAQRALLGLLHRHEMQVKRFKWKAPIDDTLWFQGYHWDIESKLEPRTQGRVVDVAAALAAWRPNADEGDRVTFAIEDTVAPWNAGGWLATVEGGRIEVTPTDESPQVELDIQAFTQAFFGTPTLDQIRSADRLRVHDENGYAALKSMLDGPPAWLNDEF